MSIRFIGLFVLCMLLAILAFQGPAAAAIPAGVLSAAGLLIFLGGILAHGIRRPVV